MITADEAREKMKTLEQNLNPLLDHISSMIESACSNGERRVTWAATYLDVGIRNSVIDALKKCGYEVAEGTYQLDSMKHWYTIFW
jgi:hypothetical protein